MTKGLQTASRVKVLNGTTGTTDMLWTVNYYDDYGRVTKSYQQHYAGGIVSPGNYDEISNTWSFTNELKTVNRIHHKQGAADLPINTTYTYDHMGRKLSTTEQINGGSTVTLSQYTYNDIGQLREKKLHSEYGTNFIEPISYTYNPRDWLKSISSAKFTENLYYESLSGTLSGAQAEYNGNISEAWYNSPNRGDKRFYYLYDKLNRLNQSKYYAGTGYNGELDESLSYDKMGNISSLNRGSTGSMSYTYSGSFGYSYTGNRLDAVSNNGGSYRNYGYDANGNMTANGALTFEYNMLNLPQYVKQSGSTVITYTYSATGEKLRKQSQQTGTTDYVSGIQYENNSIAFIQTEEGRYYYNSGQYQYNLKDHLGNVRAMIAKNTSTTSALLQENEYYAFGLDVSRYDASTGNKYLYNGKELQEELGQYDFKYRFYDPVIARFVTVDRLAEKYPWYTPYQFAGNEVPNAIDLDGLEPAYLKPNGTFTTARDGQLQRPLTGSDLVQIKAYVSTLGTKGGHERSIDGALNTGAGILNIGGLAVQGLGYVAAPFTGGSSLTLVPSGEILSTVGGLTTISNDVRKEDYTGAALTGASLVGFGVLGKELGTLEKAGKVTAVEKNILGALATTAGALTDAGIDQSKEKKEEAGSKPLPVPPTPKVQQDATTVVNPYIRPIN